ncbi:hypothetical protein EHS25_007389 [Saitozyma podzolica]|uniref:beta-glucosidase n=1 Tax=Saitozyma podzolica TaxID=1890683 RepID=A0A427YPS0_9TREE|nr:hypothetical protein EHS25_007389 [Saitozyma podzolica]
MICSNGPPSRVFPPTFKWGLASSAVQVEGGATSDSKGPSVWDTKASTPGQIFDGSSPNVCNDSYHLCEEDLKLLKLLGVRAYRFSISWPRVIPKGGRNEEINPAGLDYYSKLVDMLLENGIEPFVTIFHWDTPTALDEAYGSWRDADNMVADFARYAEVLFQTLGDRVKRWMTINEPIAMLFFPTMGGLYRNWRPEIDNWKTVYTLLKAHGTVVDLYRRRYQPSQGGTIGIVLSADWPEPLDDTEACRKMCQRRMDYFLGVFADPIYHGKYPEQIVRDLGDRLPALTDEDVCLIKGSTDNFCLNTYSSVFVTGQSIPREKWGPHSEMTGAVEESYLDHEGKPIGNAGHPFFLYDVPWGFRKMLRHIQKRYLIPLHLPLIITENGFAVKDEAKMRKEDCLNDVQRVNYYKGYLAELSAAVNEDALNCIGYFAWTIADNWEWASLKCD